MTMREIVTKEWLTKEIDARMGHPRWEGRKFWTSVEVLRRRKERGPNWSYQFNEGEVPVGFAKRWAEVREKFEESYAIREE